MAEPSGPADAADRWRADNQRYLAGALDVLRLRLAGDDEDAIAAAERHRDDLGAAMTEPPALDRIAERLGLSGFERDVLLMCAGVELDTPFAHACAAAQGEPERTYATFGLGLTHYPDARWSALSPAGPLRRLRLVSLSHPAVPATSALRIEERVLHSLMGVDYVDPEVEPFLEPWIPGRAAPVGVLHEAAVAAAARLAAPTGAAAPPPRVLLHGRPSADLRLVAATALRRAGLRPVALAPAAVPADAAGQDRLARLCEREALLDRIGWLADLDGADPAQRRAALDMVGRITAPVVVTAREPAAGSRLEAAVIGVDRASAAEMRQSWQAALGAAGVPLAGWIDRVAGQFDLSVDAVRAVVAEVGCEATGDPDAAGGRLWDACRRRVRPELDDLAQRIEPRADWADVVLPEAPRRTLRQIAAHLRHRLVVLDDWGFADRTSRGLGTAVLFAGPSGTGKTLAAEVIAGALGLDLYRVDLSQTVSKYIGETEKNLGRIFDAADAGGGVLLFDEADALFGKRSEVKDSHDRYANIEVGYLLQRVEAFRGLAVLTTNMMDSLDAAVLRRLRFVVQFPFPDAEARQEIWRRALPARTPTEGLDPVALARLSIPGGTIHSIALSAAFLAADAGEPVRMDHILTAARTEYRKQERPLTRAETTGWATREPNSQSDAKKR